MNDQTLAGDTTPAPRPAAPSLAVAAVETVLDVDEIMTQARLVERTARICLRGDLQAELDDIMDELANLVDADGNILSEGDQALADQSRANELLERRHNVLADMAGAMRTIRFRAMPDDTWRAWEKAHQDASGQYKDVDEANADLIATTAIAPKLTLEQVKQMRSKLGPTQIGTLANKAFEACTSGGVDVPKSLPFSAAPRQNPSGRN